MTDGEQDGPRRSEGRGPEEDLAMIRQLMSESRRTAGAGGPFYVLWGGVVLAGLLLTYLSVRTGLAVPRLFIWIGAIGAGWVGSFVLGRRLSERAPVQTPGGRVMMGIWVGGGVTGTLLGFAVPAAGLVSSAGETLGPIAMVLGGCYFASSYVTRSSAMRWMAAGWWAGGTAMLWWNGIESLLIMGALVLGLQLLPGIWLLRSEDAGAAAAT